MWNLSPVRLETVLVSVQDRCMVCDERTTASKVIMVHTMELLGDMGHVESCFTLYGDCVNIGPFGDTR
jgi:hypothetical protein